ncbi:glycosyltransferase family 87 protein [Rhodococcus sp. IEGM 1354]|uniref:glycosyltransferase family 87 protein n=1 Tax=Rhodococcus sp. IEGM 1354 TaxID=3047088 RepID=UPI0024B7A05F|nr:glycosyltransferase family 87 protein [Rhodococcus sp. IEGM 1354]MDI9933184.1 glycosyltransferase family 87 protein [Rhodococcus sp. IEGM 1354]
MHEVVDLAVFQDAGTAYLHKMPLYSDEFPTRSGLRFIYPPIAAVMFAPLVLLDTITLQFNWTALNIVLVWWVLNALLRRLDVVRPALIACSALGVALLMEPVRSNLDLGQINIVLMALVVADCTDSVPNRFRGIATAVAASVKVTPAAFGLYLLARGDVASIKRALVTAATLAMVGFWLLPGASAYFWHTEFFATERGGVYEFGRNQALTGLISRLGAEGSVRTALWLILATAVVGAAVWSARRFVRSGETVVAFAVIALASLLAAPFAVNHHWVYGVVLLPLAIADRYRSWRPLLMLAIIVFVLNPYRVLDGIGPSTAWSEVVVRQVVGNAQCLIGVVLLIAAVLQARSRHATRKPELENSLV